MYFIENQKISKATFFNKVDVSYNNFKGRSLKSELGGDKIAKILTTYPVLNSDWLLTGRGKMLRSQENVELNHSDINPNILKEMISLSSQLGEQKQENFHLKQRIEKLVKKNKRLQEELILVKSERKNECPAIDIVEKYHTKEKKPYSRA